MADVRTANVMLQKRRLELLNAENEYHEVFRQMTALIGCLNECLGSAVSKRGQHRSLRPIWKSRHGSWSTERRSFHLTPMAVQRKFLPGYKMNVYGYNGSMLGPTIKVSQGDRVRIISPVDRDFGLIFQNFFIDSTQTIADSWRMD